MSELNEMNLHQRLHAITNEIETVAKNLNVGTGGNNSYKGVAEADVLRAIKPLEFKYGVYSYPASRTIHHQEVFRWEEKYGTKVNQKKQFVMRTEVIYRFVNIDKPEQFLEVTSYGDGIDSGDKAPGKAQTYADKFAILKAYKMVTGEDPESRHSDDIVVPPIQYEKPIKKDDSREMLLDMITTITKSDVTKKTKCEEYINYYDSKETPRKVLTDCTDNQLKKIFNKLNEKEEVE